MLSGDEKVDGQVRLLARWPHRRNGPLDGFRFEGVEHIEHHRIQVFVGDAHARVWSKCDFILSFLSRSYLSRSRNKAGMRTTGFVDGRLW